MIFKREIIVEVPDDMTDAQLGKALGDGDREFGGAGEFIHALKKHGISNPSGYDDDFRSPDDVQSECEHYDYIADDPQ